MKFISIGPYCATGDILKNHHLKTESYPFDNIFSSLEIVKHCFDDKFKVFLDKQYYTPGNCNKSTRHSFYAPFLDTHLLILHHMVVDGFSSDYKPSSGNFFNHHNLMDDTGDYEKFQRRCARLLSLFESNEKIVFFYYNRYTRDFNDLIDFCNHFSYNKNIYIVGVFENMRDHSKILYENVNCKIYQNYDMYSILDDVKNNFK
jgi:hypothetical protein